MTHPLLTLFLAPPPEDEHSRDLSSSERDEVVSTLSEDDVACIAKVQSGDANALASLHQQHWAGLARYASRLTKSPETAAELVQETFLHIWTHRAGWTVRGSIASYLYISVRGRALHALRRERVRDRHAPEIAGIASPDADEATVPPPDWGADTERLLAIVEHVIEGLAPRSREAFLLYREQGLSLADVARTMGTSVGTTKVHIRRAVAALRQALAPYLEN